MIRLPKFHYIEVRDVRGALRAMHDDAATPLAGGTDLFPNMKRRQQMPEVVVGLRNVSELKGVTMDGKKCRIGPMTSLSAIEADRRIRETATSLWRAAKLISTPPLRNMGTLGGNLCLDTRCNYYDQSYEWRASIDFCMKKDGKICWVAPSSPRCWAVSSTDGAPALIALGATVTLESVSGTREIALEDFYVDDGMDYTVKKKDELLTKIEIPDLSAWKSTYWKLRRRGAFDFPVLSVAAAVRMKGKVIQDLRVVLGAVASRPLLLSDVGDAVKGKMLNDDTIEEIATKAMEIASPMDNTDHGLLWRKKMVKQYVQGALKELLGGAPTDLSFEISCGTALPVLS